MKELSAALREKLQQKNGLEPVILVEVQWTDDGQRFLYSDRMFGDALPQVLSVDGLDLSVQLDNAGDSQQVSIVLDDVDGAIKDLLDKHDVHQRPIWVYQSFQGLTTAHRIPLFRGQIVSPLEWDEGSRSISFSALTRLEAIEVAFSMEEGDFPVVPEDARGVTWPLVFGEVCHMPTVEVRSPIKGVLERGEGIHDFTLPNRITQAQYVTCPDISIGHKLVTGGVAGTGSQFANFVETYVPDKQCVYDRWVAICELSYLYEQQLSLENDILPIRGGSRFPQGREVTININGAYFTGSFSGDDFHVTSRKHPKRDDIELIEPQKPRTQAIRPVASKQHEGWTRFKDLTWRVRADEDCDADPVTRNQLTGGAEEARQLYHDMPKASFVWLPAGSDVYLEEESEILHVISLLPGVVNQVAAYRKMPSGPSLLMEVPSEYYTVHETDYGSYEVLELHLTKKLSQFDETWEDGLYVSVTSSIGPNPVDVIEWLVGKYTSLTIDSASFSHVRTRMENYPVNFWVDQRKGVLELIQEIVYQIRCASYIRDNILYLRYLSEEPTSVRTLTSADILTQTLRITHTPTEDLETKHAITWAPAGVATERGAPVERSLILKYNVAKYGTRTASKKYYTQNTFETILKSATFWLIRNSQTWKLLEFETTIAHLDLDLFDCVTVDIPQLAGVPIKCVITKAQVNMENNSIQFEAWTPLLAGTTESYQWAWPADQSPELCWPLPGDEKYADPNPGVKVTPPLGHVLSGGGPLTGAVVSSGDPHPSDLDDEFPELLCETSDFEHVHESEPRFKELNAADRRFEQPARLPDPRINVEWPEDEEPEPNEEPEEPEEEEEDEDRDGAGCTYEVRVMYINPTSVTSGGVSKDGCKGGPCWCGAPGKVCTGPTFWKTHIFSSRYAASMFIQDIRNIIEAAQHPNACPHECGIEYPYSLPWGDPIRVVPDPENPDQECEWSGEGDPDHPMADMGETFSPIVE